MRDKVTLETSELKLGRLACLQIILEQEFAE